MSMTFTPILALCTDAFGTFITQAGYIFMKQGQISNSEDSDSPSGSANRFCSIKWIFGVFIVSLGCMLHAGKSKKSSFNVHIIVQWFYHSPTWSFWRVTQPQQSSPARSSQSASWARNSFLSMIWQLWPSSLRATRWPLPSQTSARTTTALKK